MIRYPLLGLATILLLIAAGARGGDVPAALASSEVTVYRCVDIKGRVSLQGDPCPKGSQQVTRQMQRPIDPPPRPAANKKTAAAKPAPAPMLEPEPPPQQFFPPPPMFRCTSYDGIVRDSEVYDPNPRCEPLALYYPEPQSLTPAQAGSCRWVQDSCVRLSDDAACDLLKKKKREAASAAMHAFSDTAAYRKSELERLTQIIDESCP
ncbi:MAG TPA: DUF4124 domain-containing protein [Arenimonas sp.]|uniref:DUF4124 domain-containing protein n=1 Tax=Arenimonas sp. TaxID=1872635 RepID=UPI002B95C2C2|nr:DUF4124 domain-containing protein [Arenimonas sp.]HMB56224.1 DUF4124 domain-containing protein [Arenimonas sp.]